MASVYLEANKHGYHASLGLCYLSIAEPHATNRMQDLPSWAIDYTQKKTKAFLDQWFRHKTFSAAGKRDPIVLFSDPNTNCLVLDGAFVGIVEKCAPGNWDKSVSSKLRWFHLARESPSSWERTLSSVFSHTHEGRNSDLEGNDPMLRVVAYVSSIYAAMSLHLESVDPVLGQKFEEDPKSFLKKVLQVCSTSCIPAGNIDSSSYETLLSAIKQLDLKSMWMAWFANQNVFYTSKGYVGIGSKYVLPGDRVYLVAGANVPYLFRHIPNRPNHHVQLVGETYMDPSLFVKTLEEDATVANEGPLMTRLLREFCRSMDEKPDSSGEGDSEVMKDYEFKPICVY